MDVNMPILSGIEALLSIKEKYTEINKIKASSSSSNEEQKQIDS